MHDWIGRPYAYSATQEVAHSTPPTPVRMRPDPLARLLCV